MTSGYIYIMTNPGLNNMVKIGYATDVEARRKQLSTTALPYDYELYATYKTSGKLEDRTLHKLIDTLNPHLRVTKKREFFVMSPEDAYGLLESIATISGSRNRLKRRQPAARKNPRRPPVNFMKCGIPMGAELVYVDDPAVRVIVAGARKVQYKNELRSLSGIAREIRKRKAERGPSCFTYNGEIVSEIARRTQWSNP